MGWNSRPRVLLKKKKGMLVLEVFKGHLTPEIKTTFNSTNTNLVVIPGWITL
jgi:hypothetical protein